MTARMAAKVLDGATLIARTRLTTPTGEVVAEIGETCERVDPRSLEWLKDQGLIAPIGDGAATESVRSDV